VTGDYGRILCDENMLLIYLLSLVAERGIQSAKLKFVIDYIQTMLTATSTDVQDTQQ
jgi:hypothetical protein